jgi:hypothetical protein
MIHSYFLLLSLLSVAYAQTAQIERIDIVGKGIYQVATGKQTPEKQTPTGVATSVENVKKLEDTTTVPARPGLEFGIEYVIVGMPKGAQVPVRIVKRRNRAEQDHRRRDLCRLRLRERMGDRARGVEIRALAQEPQACGTELHDHDALR